MCFFVKCVFVINVILQCDIRLIHFYLFDTGGTADKICILIQLIKETAMFERSVIAYAMRLYRDGWSKLSIIGAIETRYNVSGAYARWALARAMTCSLL